MKKIAILAPEIHEPFIEGIQKNAWSFSLAALKSGYDLNIFTQRSYGEKIEVSDLKIFYYINSFKLKLVKYFLWFFDGCRISKKIKKEKITDILVFSLDWSFVWPLIWIGISQPQIKISLVIFSGREVSGLNRIFFLITKKYFKHFFVRSQYLFDKLLSLGVSKEIISLVISFPQKESFLENRRELPKEIKTIAYLSNTEKSAGIETVVYLAKELPDVKFILAIRKFSSAEEKKVSDFIRKMNLTNFDNIEIRRNINNIKDFYKEVEAIILPVVDENNTMASPLVLLEALCSGCLVLARKIKVFAEYQEALIFFEGLDDLKEKIINISKEDLIKVARSRESLVEKLQNEKQVIDIYLK